MIRSPGSMGQVSPAVVTNSGDIWEPKAGYGLKS